MSLRLSRTKPSEQIDYTDVEETDECFSSSFLALWNDCLTPRETPPTRFRIADTSSDAFGADPRLASWDDFTVQVSQRLSEYKFVAEYNTKIKFQQNYLLVRDTKYPQTSEILADSVPASDFESTHQVGLMYMSSEHKKKRGQPTTTTFLHIPCALIAASTNNKGGSDGPSLYLLFLWEFRALKRNTDQRVPWIVPFDPGQHQRRIEFLYPSSRSVSKNPMINRIYEWRSEKGLRSCFRRIDEVSSLVHAPTKILHAGSIVYRGFAFRSYDRFVSTPWDIQDPAIGAAQINQLSIGGQFKSFFPILLQQQVDDAPWVAVDFAFNPTLLSVSAANRFRELRNMVFAGFVVFDRLELWTQFNARVLKLGGENKAEEEEDATPFHTLTDLGVLPSLPTSTKNDGTTLAVYGRFLIQMWFKYVLDQYRADNTVIGSEQLLEEFSRHWTSRPSLSRFGIRNILLMRQPSAV